MEKSFITASFLKLSSSCARADKKQTETLQFLCACPMLSLFYLFKAIIQQKLTKHFFTLTHLSIYLSISITLFLKSSDKTLQSAQCVGRHVVDLQKGTVIIFDLL